MTRVARVPRMNRVPVSLRDLEQVQRTSTLPWIAPHSTTQSIKYNDPADFDLADHVIGFFYTLLDLNPRLKFHAEENFHFETV